VRAILVIPIHVRAEWWGGLALSVCRQEREWSGHVIDSLRLAGSLLGALIERQQMEEALRRSETQYRTLVEGANQPIVIVDHEGVFRFANSAASVDLGIPVEQIQGRTMAEIFAPDDATEQMASIRAVLETGETVVHRRRTRIGTASRWYEARIQPLRGPEGEREAALIFLQDISQRMEVEGRLLTYQARLRRLSSDLALSEQRERRRLASVLHDGIGQTLAVSKIKLGAMRASARDGPWPRVWRNSTGCWTRRSRTPAP